MTETASNAPPVDQNTAAGLMEFLDAAIEKGWLNGNTAKSLKTATTRILSIDDGWEDLDLRSLDLDGLYDRFRNLKRNDYSDETMRIYKVRTGQAVRMHLARLEGKDWKALAPSARSNGNGAAKKAGPKKAVAAVLDALPAPDTVEATTSFPTSAAASTRTPLMQFPYPLRDNLDVHLSLPRDLTKAEAERLARFIGTLAREEQKAITAGVAPE